jgi:uncharacterized protein (DUF952 family)
VIYHFINRENLARFQKDGVVRLPSLEKEGFMHCSTLEQVLGVANRISPYDEEMLLLQIDESNVGPEVRYENLEGGTILYPHIYGPLNEDAIIQTYLLEWDGEEGYQLPRELEAELRQK